MEPSVPMCTGVSRRVVSQFPMASKPSVPQHIWPCQQSVARRPRQFPVAHRQSAPQVPNHAKG